MNSSIASVFQYVTLTNTRNIEWNFNITRTNIVEFKISFSHQTYFVFPIYIESNDLKIVQMLLD